MDQISTLVESANRVMELTPVFFIVACATFVGVALYLNVKKH